ncbi:calcium-binding protein [uncultured Roseobacter sp.]|uniref:calcium-binding protein n=1 Tax=uncultured Roseobacter sp. TaxID=114847 RepID=UPI0026275369|nr:calcium-binding protein [uncultured Roseobacter sp.]
MSVNQNQSLQIGTHLSEALYGTTASDYVVGLSGDDVIRTDMGDDVVFGDFLQSNLLNGTENATSFAQYAETGVWAVTTGANGHTSMSQAVDTRLGEVYEIRFDLAANYGAGSVSGAVEVLWNGTVIDSFDTNSASFSAHDITFEGVDGIGELTFRSIDSAQPTGPVIHTDGPIYYYEKQMQIGDQPVEVKAFAEGQPNIYQVINGTLQVFDPQAGTYTRAGETATVTVNAIGFNTQDDMIYGLAVSNGTDSLGNAVASSDLVMLDASGASFRIGTTPYRSWTGDFDADGNLWAFQSSMDRITMIDVDDVGADGAVATKTFPFPKSMITDQLWDVAFDAQSGSFFGVTRPIAEGRPSTLYQIDISTVADGGVPTISTTQITGTVIDGILQDGVPQITFGAAIHDADGNLYVGGNGGDHDMNDATASAGGIYRVVQEAGSDTAHLELVATSPKSYSNDGTADPRAMDPFTEIDRAATVLIRDLNVAATTGGDTSYDDVIENGAGADAAHGGIGDDKIAGQSGNDTLTGGDGDDQLFGGNSDRSAAPVAYTYDGLGNRYDAAGNLLPEDNDTLFGGAGADMIHGGAGNDQLDGGTGDDELIGGSGFDTLHGGDGHDQLSGGSENDHLYGGVGDDTLTGGTGNDHLFGDAGADTLAGGEGDDVMDGGAGNDLLNGGVGDDLLNGGQGDDVLRGSTGNDILTDAHGNNTMEGGSGHDQLTGGSGIDHMTGGSGNDILSGGGARDVLKGGTGDDRLDGGDDKDKLYGGTGNDVIHGGNGSDYINASAGDDQVDAGAGRDKILLGAGDDIALGGADTDWFVFRAEDMDGGTDTIQDFTCDGVENDRLDFRLLELLAAGQSKSEWVAEHVVQNQDHSVTIDVQDLTVNLWDHNDMMDAFYLQVCDGLEL